MTIRLVEKIEELTLYLIEIKKENTNLADKLKLLENELSNMKKTD